MTLETIEFRVALSDIVGFDLIITTARKEPVTIHRVPPHLIYGCIVSMDFIYVATSLPWIPNLHILVLAASENE